MPDWFEWLKLSASFSTPVIVAIIGYFLNRRLKSIDDAQWQSRKIIEKRLEIYDEIAPDINKIFCFCRFLGYWKEVSPPELLQAKRTLDKTVNIYRHLLSEEFYSAYNDYIHTAFRTYTGRGRDALIRSSISNHWGDRRTHVSYSWAPDFDAMFDENDLPSDDDLQQKYLLAMKQLRACVGLSE